MNTLISGIRSTRRVSAETSARRRRLPLVRGPVRLFVLSLAGLTLLCGCPLSELVEALNRTVESLPGASNDADAPGDSPATGGSSQHSQAETVSPGDFSNRRLGEARAEAVSESNPLGVECGERTVAQLPPAGYLRESTEYTELELVGEDTGLRRLFEAVFGSHLGESSNATIRFYEIDATGAISASFLAMPEGRELYRSGGPTTADGQRLGRMSIDGGCLTKVTYADFSMQPTISNYGFDDGSGACGADAAALPIGVLGLASSEYSENPTADTSPPGFQYLCLSPVRPLACYDCWFDGAWHSASILEFELVAIADLSASVAVDGAPKAIEVKAGERVVLRQRVTTTFEVSASPEELGYSIRR